MSEQAGWERWIRTPQQERARATVERVLEAGAALLAEQGYDGFSMSEVCRRAGVAPGTLYGRVEGKEELFLALHDRELARITARGLADLDAVAARRRLSTRGLLEAVVDALGAHYAREAPLLRVFILRAAVDPRVRDEGARHLARLEEAVVGLLLTRRPDYRPRQPEAAVRAVYRIVVDSLSWRTAFGADFHPSGPETDAAWTARLRAVATSYLLGAPPGHSG